VGAVNSFLSKFGGGEDVMELSEPNLVSASAPNALDAFLDRFTALTESYFFYNNTEELRYDTEAHVYFRVDPDLGNLVELYGVTTVLRIIDKSNALVPWASKKCAEKILRTIPLSSVSNEFNELMLAPITLTEFTKLVMEAKNAHKEILEDAGDVGHAAHKCLEDSIQHAIDHTQGIVLELRNIPTDEKAKAAAEAGFVWMSAHNVRWIKTEQKIYSKEYQYAGTLDGKALVDCCNDPACCTEQFKDSLSIVDWKSSNALHVEYILQAAGAYCHAEHEEYGEDIQNCFILRLGKNEEEAGKFEPWRVPAKDFPEAFQGFLLCLNLVKLLGTVKERINTQKKGVREIKKQQKAEQKVIDKANAKAQREAEKAQKKLDRAEERERIKADAKRAREEAKRQGKVSTHDRGTGNSRISTLERSSGPTLECVEREGTAAQSNEETSSPSPNQLMVGEFYEETTIVRRPFVIVEEG
jgi:hypothetical protein